jgi:hypothetical protein
MLSCAHGCPSLAPSFYAAELRRELSECNLRYAHKHGLPHALSYGSPAVVCYRACDAGHGNFLPAAWGAIERNPAWRRRLQKVHTSGRTALPAAEGGRWRELDSANSSDALLMNIFCSPGVLREGRVAQLLGVERGARPEFGVRARVPITKPNREDTEDAEVKQRRIKSSVSSAPSLLGICFDRTEIDMRWGELLVEAKLTESDFQVAPRALVEHYRDLAVVFERRLLPRSQGRYLHYQLVRNVLAAHAGGCAFCVLLDARRPDLLEAWYTVLRAIRAAELRTRCKALTWQELAAATPRSVAQFLEEKYGIV